MATAWPHAVGRVRLPPAIQRSPLCRPDYLPMSKTTGRQRVGLECHARTSGGAHRSSRPQPVHQVVPPRLAFGHARIERPHRRNLLRSFRYYEELSPCVPSEDIECCREIFQTSQSPVHSQARRSGNRSQRAPGQVPQTARPRKPVCLRPDEGPLLSNYRPSEPRWQPSASA